MQSETPQLPEPVLRHVTCASPKGLHRLAYWQWDAREGGPAGKGTIVCVHGLTRNGRDFDALAARLSERHRVVCPDIAGRGRSDRLADPMLYGIPQYLADCVTLIARLDVDKVDWVGTSMGGLIGMTLASLPGNPIGRLVLNDIGPHIDPAGLERIAGYVGDDPSFDSFEQGEATLRELMRDFGPHTDAQFRLLSRHYVIRKGERWGYHYDPAIAVPFRALAGLPQPDLWPMWDAIACPTLAIRGANSDILPAQVVAAMSARGPRARVVEFDGVGHAPTLIADEQIAAVQDFLNEE
ncbi:alpha/beta hydrolase [Burkholderiaceae bacterium FT117]|uniref:alpha/beta fold hydrolase n=1 Tax=Zeimonas sediminis TaxID=2944268 RepID=UPI002342E70F|nr:alpha/beta hydrolase [Zeimonas sediminis]MCM5568918.1 alpha/beta hydrolase [Zeimonas sediminis]